MGSAKNRFAGSNLAIADTNRMRMANVTKISTTASALVNVARVKKHVPKDRQDTYPRLAAYKR